MVSPSYSSAILGPPPSTLLFLSTVTFAVYQNHTLNMAVPLLAWFFGYCLEQNSPANQLSIRNIHFVELSYDPAISLMGVFPDKTIIRRDTWAFAWWFNGEDSAVSSVGAVVRSLSRELDPICCSDGSHLLQQRPVAAKQINTFLKKIHAPYVATLLTIAQTWKQPKCSSTEGWQKDEYIYTTS